MRRNQKFLRTGYSQYSKLGLRRKKKMKYRRSNGIDNKVRLKMKGHLRNVSIGFRNEKDSRDKLKGLTCVSVSNLEELKNVKKDEIALITKIGNKKKFEMMEYAIKNNIAVFNVNPKKFVEKVKQELEKRKEEKLKMEEKKKGKEKRAKEAEKKKEEKSEDKKEDVKHEHHEHTHKLDKEEHKHESAK